MPATRNPQSAVRNGRAFTLIEVMVSIALVLVIILGVNAIFKMASDTVGAGNALGAANRENRSAQTVFYNDLQTAVITDGPMILIRSEVVPAFRNHQDENEDADGKPLTVDMDGNNREGEANVRGEVTPALITNSRNHRVDRLNFFASHLFRRQTGTELPAFTTFVDASASSEAYISYSHLAQPDFGKPLGGTPGHFEHRGPGELPKTQNPNNYYASDWILGRSVILLREQVPPNENFIAFSAKPADRLTPLSPDSQAFSSDLRYNVKDKLTWSRYDMANTSINAYKGTLQFDIGKFGSAIGAATTWYEILGGEWGPAGTGRFQGYPYPDKPLTPYGLARTIPVFVRGCTQFTVEFAGDYLNQAPDGKILGSYLNGPSGTDGQVDFMIVKEQPHPSELARKVRRIRWYGMPRNVDLLDDGAGPKIAGAPGADSQHQGMYDVIPLRDLLSLAPGVGANGVPAPPPPLPSDYFEHLDGDLQNPLPNYASLGTNGDYTAEAEYAKKLRYYAAWGPNDLKKGSLTRPKMLRITMTVDDPSGRLTEGQTYEYVINLP